MRKRLYEQKSGRGIFKPLPSLLSHGVPNEQPPRLASVAGWLCERPTPTKKRTCELVEHASYSASRTTVLAGTSTYVLAIGSGSGSGFLLASDWSGSAPQLDINPYTLPSISLDLFSALFEALFESYSEQRPVFLRPCFPLIGVAPAVPMQAVERRHDTATTARR